MRRLWMKIAITLGICALLSLPLWASAETNATIHLLSGDEMTVGMFSGGQALIPGVTATQTYTLVNTSEAEIRVALQARHADLSDFQNNETQYRQSRELLELLELKMTMRSPDAAGDVVYKGNLQGHASENSFDLGSVSPGGSAVLEVEITVPKFVDNRYNQAVGKFWWSIISTEIPQPQKPPPPESRPDPKPPAKETRPDSEWEEEPVPEPKPEELPPPPPTVEATVPPAEYVRPPAEASRETDPVSSEPEVEPEPESEPESLKERTIWRVDVANTTELEGDKTGGITGSDIPYPENTPALVEQAGTPTALTRIRDQMLPSLWGFTGVWSLVNLLIVILSALLLVVRIARGNIVKKRMRFYEDPDGSVHELPPSPIRYFWLYLLPHGIGLVQPAIFLLLEDLSGIMVIADPHTVPMLALFAVHIVGARPYFQKIKRKKHGRIGLARAAGKV